MSRVTLRRHVRGLATVQPAPPASIAVLGGGIAGLSAAYFLQKQLPPSTKLTVYDKAPRIGGWVSSKTLQAENSTQFVFEEGPRSLRPAGLPGLSALDLVYELGLEDKLILVPKTSASAKNRFIYFAGKVRKAPSSFLGALNFILFSPLSKGLIPGILREPFRRNRPRGATDESIRDFVGRRFSPYIADNLFSAIIHGVYAGDITKLSIRSTQPLFWDLESKAGSIVRALWKGHKRATLMPEEDKQLLKHLENKRPELASTIKSTSIYTFKNGIQDMTDALQTHLAGCKNVEIRCGQRVSSLAADGAVTSTSSTDDETPQTEQFDHIVSALPSTQLALALAPSLPSHARDILSGIPSVTVAVVNLYYDDPSVLPVEGFGYLIPRSVSVSENPGHVLGVVFDSSSVPSQDTARGTKVTCMIGGHHWGTSPSPPHNDSLIATARDILHRHLNVPTTTVPHTTNVALQRDCIPQYHVGHGARMRTLHHHLHANHRNLTVVGAFYAGVSVNDCILNARKAAYAIANTHAHTATGLESFANWQ
ncbi:oxygen-dependent protoporphyrinogen oxidase [Savitreella phatthalungensis]